MSGDARPVLGPAEARWPRLPVLWDICRQLDDRANQATGAKP